MGGEASSPETAYSREQRALLAGRIEFHRWLQWLCDEQLEAAQRRPGGGMEIGIIHDLAVGVKPGGADDWSLAGVLARNVSVGAPPDMFNQQGQNWTQPPWHPGRLAESGTPPTANAPDGAAARRRHPGGPHSGAVPAVVDSGGCRAGEGTYVYYDDEALIGILALEAQRAGAIVIGEDLGVFEPWVRDYLAERGILGTSILWFEHDGDGPIPPERYRHSA